MKPGAPDLLMDDERFPKSKQQRILKRTIIGKVTDVNRANTGKYMEAAIANVNRPARVSIYY
jgi:hypothetical protein